MTFKEAFWLTLASLGTGFLIGIYSLLASPINLIASVLAMIIAFYYFRNFQRKGLRIGYVIFVILYYIFFIFAVSVYKFNQLDLTLMPGIG
ncbi:hypothetical protein [Paenibacillus sp. IHBB 10380]|jgi:hypothetical protein|uniref:hypothetical protein n=1 Tax=Paenibacillus sp. IHBB 10380 TaxID=1566358 RepID=UPI0005CFCFD3|nr:hypothetical protein [Paenibacillus sp. IHBB 10380]AJS57868.1 hypothetical protein UB51_04460 [Paenibacillus sp. IHBB 10380]